MFDLENFKLSCLEKGLETSRWEFVTDTHRLVVERSAEYGDVHEGWSFWIYTNDVYSWRMASWYYFEYDPKPNYELRILRNHLPEFVDPSRKLSLKIIERCRMEASKVVSES